jgi:glycosyltransferase involved in cell wall biosynthesis
MIESLFYGCPVFGTPYGALPEIVTPDVGFLSNRCSELAAQLEQSARFDPKTCHEHAVSQFNSKKMALSYLTYYQKVLDGVFINEKPPQLLEIQKDKFLPWIA